MANKKPKTVNLSGVIVSITSMVGPKVTKYFAGLNDKDHAQWCYDPYKASRYPDKGTAEYCLTKIFGAAAMKHKKYHTINLTYVLTPLADQGIIILMNDDAELHTDDEANALWEIYGETE